ncbi:hypothetical protein ACP70R_003914 [Stipagrostis hirtigluma subsp. patula]
MHGHPVFSERLGSYRSWSQIPPLEEKVFKWTKQHPVIWNAGIGAAASFVPTLTRLLFERSKDDLYGSYDHIVSVRLPPNIAADPIAAQRWVALEVLTEMARILQVALPGNKLIIELNQLAAEENYYGYGRISEYLMLKAFGQVYIDLFEQPTYQHLQFDPIYRLQPYRSEIHERISAEVKRYLVLVENLHVLVPLGVLVFTVGKRPSLWQDRWLISSISKDVYNKSIRANSIFFQRYSLNPEFHHAPPFNDLNEQDWAVLIKEALRDAASSIHKVLQGQQDKEFWLCVAHRCLYYAVLYHPLQVADEHKTSTKTISFPSVSSSELVRCWVAEHLLFSEVDKEDEEAEEEDGEVVTNIAEATSKKQSRYMSTYEAGKVVIQALQEYSLLPTYSVSAPTSSTSSAASTSASSLEGAVTGVSKLAEDAPRLERAKLLGVYETNKLGWVSFLDDYGRHVSWDWRWERASILHTSTLILRGCSNVSGFHFDKVFNRHLHVLDLSYTQINSLPPFSKLLNLRLLSLRGCFRLETLSASQPVSEEETPPLAYLGKLQVLDMNGVPLLKVSQKDGRNKSNLHYLDLSGSRITTFPSEFFCEMTNLEELIIGNCSNLKELPPSLTELSNLVVLHVEGTHITSFPVDMFKVMQRLHTLKLINNMLLMSLPSSLSKATDLRELHIYNCISLTLEFIWELMPSVEDLYIQAWEALEFIIIHGHPNLRTFSVSGPRIRCLSLRGCSKLKIVNFSDDLTALEDADLSGTAIEEVPHNLPNLPHLRMLLLLNVPCFKRFPWHQLVRFPKVFCLDHCVDEDNQFSKVFGQQEIRAAENRQREQTTNTAQININDPRMFHSFNMGAAYELVEKGQFLQSFCVQVKPCRVRGMEPKIKDVELCTDIQRQSPYLDINYSGANSIMPMMNIQPTQRHVEISANNRYPNGLRHLLSVTNSIFIKDDDFVKCLTDLNYSLMSLEQCQLKHCHQMTVVLRMNSVGSEALPSLKVLQGSNLKNLLCFVQPSLWFSGLLTLKLLKHIHLEDCPRLVKIFPCCLSLPMLESLVILFCPNLKTIFYEDPHYDVAPSPLPNIERICLQELPQLQHIHEDVMFRSEMARWEKLFVRGCPSFQRLPLLKQEHLKLKVEVSGERDWYDKLQFILPDQRDYYLHVPPPEFASRKKSVIIKSYLR